MRRATAGPGRGSGISVSSRKEIDEEANPVTRRVVEDGEMESRMRRCFISGAHKEDKIRSHAHKQPFEEPYWKVLSLFAILPYLFVFISDYVSFRRRIRDEVVPMGGGDNCYGE